MGTSSGMLEPRVGNHQISERVAVLSGQIQDITNLTAQYRAKNVRSHTDRTANQLREVRLLQIREELRQMLKKRP